MDRYTYAEVLESVEDDFQSSYKLGDDDQQATLRLLDDFYREIMRNNPLEAFMFYTAIFNSLYQRGKSVDYLKDKINECYEKYSVEGFKSELNKSEIEQLLVDVEKVKAIVH
ncbi:MAG: hypothetical protein ABW101_07405 [Candidatus Thiodiazotropha sp.]